MMVVIHLFVILGGGNFNDFLEVSFRNLGEMHDPMRSSHLFRKWVGKSHQLYIHARFFVVLRGDMNLYKPFF